MDWARAPGCPDEEQEVEEPGDGADQVAGVLFLGVGVGVLGPMGWVGGVGAEEGVEGWEVRRGGGG